VTRKGACRSKSQQFCSSGGTSMSSDA